MKKQLNLDQANLTIISNEDAMIIDGGDFDSGKAAGIYVRHIIDGVGVLDLLWTIAKAIG